MQRLITLITTLLLIALSGSHPYAADYLQPQNEFDAFKQQSEQQFQQSKDEFELYRQRLQSAFREYQQQAARIWGEAHTVRPTHSNWVSYQGDLQHRSVVDFEQGVVDVEIALDKGQTRASAEQQLSRTIVDSLRQGADSRSMLEIARQPVAVPRGPAVLRGQVADTHGRPVASNDYEQLARQAAAGATTTVTRGNDGKQRVIYKTQLKLVPDHIRQRAERYKKDVNTQATEHKIPAALIFAVMETESYFNPMARSPAPAFGLMQLVPTSGAREAYRYLYQQDRIVSDTYLYNPSNNIRLGTAFLNRLYYKYLSGIKNSEARQWASIAAYNTGAGNVFRTFAGKYSQQKFGSRAKWKQAALYEINRRSAEQVYSYLRNHLPYRETRGYMHKVRSRMSKYSSSQGV